MIFGFTIVRGPVFDLDMQRYLTALQLLVYSMRMFRRTMDAAEELGAATFLELKCVGRARMFSDYVLTLRNRTVANERLDTVRSN